MREEELTETEGVRPFAPEEMVACERCARANPPTRAHCLYCGAPLPSTERSARLRRPAHKRLTEWETGFNVVFHPPGFPALEEFATLLRLEPDVLREFAAERAALPLARVGSREEAELIVERLKARGLTAETVDDEELLRVPPRRVRALMLTEEALGGVGVAGEEPGRHAWEEVELLVSGRVVRKRVEVEERREKSRREGEVLDAREVATDELVLDLYVADGACWRLAADHLDYSCLGASKGLLARDNFGALVRLLRERATRAAVDEEYPRLRRLLAVAWPPAERDDTLGFRRERVGRYSTGAVTTVSNEAQFTRYSRLRHHLVRRGRA